MKISFDKLELNAIANYLLGESKQDALISAGLRPEQAAFWEEERVKTALNMVKQNLKQREAKEAEQKQVNQLFKKGLIDTSGMTEDVKAMFNLND